MLPGNSFPQICVVSVNKNVEQSVITQEYLWAMAKSNLSFRYFKILACAWMGALPAVIRL
jgi:hypothetical protein